MSICDLIAVSRYFVNYKGFNDVYGKNVYRNDIRCFSLIRKMPAEITIGCDSDGNKDMGSRFFKSFK